MIENLINSESFYIYLLSSNIVLTIIICISIIYNVFLTKRYINFMKKVGNGNNIDEMLRTYIMDVNEVKKDNDEIKAYYIQLDNNIDSCIQKIGMVRYNAFKDVGSDLSFALALLDRNDNGVVLNGLYGSESSNIYAKPIKKGESKYQLSIEEKEAIEIAEQSKNFIAKHKI